MASLQKIQEMTDFLEKWGWASVPTWMMGIQPIQGRTTTHISGQLREADQLIWGHRTGVAHEVLNEDELALCTLINEAAERLDDAHEAWLKNEVDRLEAHLECLIV